MCELSRPKSPYVGLDLVPLPFESGQSYLSRFAWQQGYNHLEVRGRIQRAFAMATEGKSIHAAHPIGQLLYITGWQPTDDSEGTFEWCKTHSVLNQYSSDFRYCPICLEGLYHSYLFQWTELKTCPIHQCQLVTSCSSCGAHIRGVGYTIGAAYYRCNFCNLALAGVELSLGLHIELRESSKLFDDRFSIIFQQFEARFDNAGIFHQFRSGDWDLTMTRSFDWCRPELPLRAAHSMQHISSQTSLEIEGITLLRWNQRWSNTGEMKLSLRDLKPGNFRGVYQATLRRLRQFAFGTVQAQHLEEALMQKLISDRRILQSEWEPTKLAFVLFRYGAEFYTWPNAAASELNKIQGIFTGLSMVTHSRRLRLAQRAWMLTIFAMILSYLYIETNWRDGRFVAATGFPKAWAPFTSDASSADKKSWGEAWFPTVPGLSLWPFVRVDKPLKSAAR